MPWLEIGIAAILLAIVLTSIGLAVRYAGKAGASGVRADVVTEARKVEAEAERYLDGPRRRGTALLERLRRKRGGDPPAPPAPSER